MKTRLQYLIVIALVGLIYGIFPSAPERETARLRCQFSVGDQAAPVEVPGSHFTIGEMRLTVELSGKSINEEVVMWHTTGTAESANSSRNFSGTVFTTLAHQVTGLALWQDGESRSPGMLRIATLNQEGMLDRNERSAFVWFESGPNKMAHPFDYACQISNQEGH